MQKSRKKRRNRSILSLMRKRLLCIFFLFTSLHAEPSSIVVHNQVLAKVHGKVISVIDVMKKLDMLFYRQFPEHIHSQEAKYQFYTTYWKGVFNDLIDRELVIADAEEKNFVVSNGDIREELEEIFGPDVMLNLDKVGLTVEDAWEMIKADILIRRMLYLEVRMRVFAQITPQTVKKAYEERVVTSNRNEECVWSTLSFRSDSPDVPLAAMADRAYTLLKQEKILPQEIQARLQALPEWDARTIVTISPQFRETLKNITPQMQQLFKEMSPGEYSKPLLQTSKNDGTPVVRIWAIHEKNRTEPPPLFQKLRCS